MAKFKKVKRYKKIYRGGSSNRRPTPIGIAATVLGVVALAVLGWSLYGPVYNFLMGNTHSNSSSSAPEDSQGKQEEVSSQQSQEPAPSGEAAIHGVYMPTSVLQSPDQRTAFLDDLAGTDINAVLFDLKEVTGGVTYQSDLSSVALAKSMEPAAVNLPEVVQELTDRGLRPIGRIHAFKDPIAPFGLTGSQVQYAGTQWTWLDNSQELGGKPWLNPFSPVAQSYILDLVGEAADSGVKEIVIDSLQFPTGFALEKADYGQAADQNQRTAVLKDFMAAAEAKAQEKGAVAEIYLPVTAVLGGEGEKYGADPALIPSGRVALGVMPSLFGNAFTSGDLALENPATDPYGTVKQALSAALPKLQNAPERLAFLQAYTATNVDPLHNKVYTGADVASQVQAVRQSGIESYILYSPQGNYELDKIPQ